MLKKIISVLAVGAALASPAVVAQGNEEYARFNAAARTWELRFQPLNAEEDVMSNWVTFRYEIRSDIKPAVRSAVAWLGDAFRYDYQVSNDRSARQVINYMYGWTSITPLPPKKADPPASELNRSPAAMRSWQLQLDQRGDAELAMQDTSLSQPRGWRRAMSFAENVTGFGWFPDIEPYGPGVPPGTKAGGFEIRRPELPGAIYAEMQGRVEEPGLPTGYKLGGPVEQAIKQIIAADQVYVPILAPSITLPVPYSTAEHARRVKTHVQTWQGDASHSPMIAANTLDRLNRQFDALIPALEGNNAIAARAAATEIFTELFIHNPGLTYDKVDQDDNVNAAQALPEARASHAATGVNRVAARALAFNLRYLLRRMELGR